MAKGSRQRAMPSTPSQRAAGAASAHDAQADRAHADPAATQAGRGAAASPAVGSPTGKPAKRREPEYLVQGTKCVGGHARGEELISAGIGRVPTRRATWMGIALVLWCALGVSFVVDPMWLLFGFQLLLLWLAFSAVVQRRAGHRRRCWRTRAWRHAWGGLVPTAKDPKPTTKAA